MVVILSIYALIAVVAYICQICALNMLNQRCVRIMLIIQRVIDTLLVLTLTKVKASTQLIHMEDLNCFIRDARFATIFLQDYALEAIVSNAHVTTTSYVPECICVSVTC